MRRQRIVWALIGLTLIGTIAAAAVGGVRLHHAVLLERQALRTEQLAQAAGALADGPSAATRAPVANAFRSLASHDGAEAARLRTSYLSFLGAPAARARLVRFESRIGTESARLTSATRVANPAARQAIIAAAVGAGLVVLLLVWQFELERRSGRIDRDNVARSVELVRLRDEFVAVVSHELRTPLTSIIGYVELLTDEGESSNLTEDQQGYLGVVRRSTVRLVDLVGDLLLVAEAGRGPLSLDVHDVDLALLVSEAAELARPSAAAKDIELDIRPETTPNISGDRMRLAQLLDNLVSNAIKFTPEGGRVTVRNFADGENSVLEVSDTGGGISAADRLQVFDPFFRARGSTARAVPGTGLGLSIAKAIVEAHGGDIDVGSAEGGGTTFRVSLPAAAQAT
jgi:signal transduction histidine kinase